MFCFHNLEVGGDEICNSWEKSNIYQVVQLCRWHPESLYLLFSLSYASLIMILCVSQRSVDGSTWCSSRIIGLFGTHRSMPQHAGLQPGDSAMIDDISIQKGSKQPVFGETRILSVVIQC